VRILDPSAPGAQQTRNLAGGIPATSVRAVSAAPYTVADEIGTVLCATMRGSVTITLPRAALHSGRSITIRKTDAGQYPVTIGATNGEPVGDSEWVQLTEKGEYAVFVSQNGEWSTPLHF